MSGVYQWCAYNGVTWFYNPKMDDWIFTKGNKKVIEPGFAMRSFPKALLNELRRRLA